MSRAFPCENHLLTALEFHSLSVMLSRVRQDAEKVFCKNCFSLVRRNQDRHTKIK